MSHKTAILICLPEIEKKASVKCSGRFIITEIANASDAVDRNEKTENRITKKKKKKKKKLKTEYQNLTPKHMN